MCCPSPSEEEIAEALRRMRKFGPEDQLNCGSCGYPSCREKAVAVCQGLAEVGMCLPYLVEELESTLSTLQRSHQATQDRLVQTERLASMGQISAGVAHEINNPLSTILLYSHMLLKAHREGDPESEDIQMIVNEANRCRSIMRGLLDFARQSRVVKTPTDLGLLVQDLVDSMNMKLGNGRVRVRGDGRGGHAESVPGRGAGPADAREPRAERDRCDRVQRRGDAIRRQIRRDVDGHVGGTGRSPSAQVSPRPGTWRCCG